MSDLDALPNASADSRFAATRSHALNDAYLARMDEGLSALGVTEKGASHASDGPERVEREIPKCFGTLRETAGADAGADADADADAEAFETSSTFSTRAASGDASAAARWLRGPVDPAGARVWLSDLPLTCASLAPTGDDVVVGGTDHSVRLVGLASATSRDARRETRNGAAVATPKAGHGEWVTCVTHDATRGFVVSGGMDSKVCVWTKRGGSSGSSGSSFLPPIVLEGHFGSVSDALAVEGAVASASYDKTVRLWRVARDGAASAKPKPSSHATLRGHRAPALRLAAATESDVSARFGGTAASAMRRSLASGDRDGAVLRWDAETASPASSRAAHEGHCTSLRWVLGADPHATPLLASGGQDGALRLWDDRQEKPVAAFAAHRRARARADGGGGEKTRVGAGAVSEIAQCAGSRRVVTAGADGYACVLDLRAHRRATMRTHHATEHAGQHAGQWSSGSAVDVSLERVARRALGDFAYSLGVAPGADAAFVGDGSGHVHCVDVAGEMSGGHPSVAFALGAHGGAARAIVATRDGKLCSAGDDGRVAVYAFGE